MVTSDYSNHVLNASINAPLNDSPPLPTNARKVLIIGPSWVGDMVMAQSLFILIKQQNPNSIIDVLAPQWSRPLLDRMPEVRRSIDMPLGHGRFGWKARREMGIQLRDEQYDQAITLPNSWKSALIPWFANIPLRTGWKGEVRYGLLNDLRVLNKTALPLMVQRFIALAHTKSHVYEPTHTAPERCPEPILIANKSRIPDLLVQYQLNTDKPIAILCPGAEFGPAKQWPSKHFSHIGRAMIKKGWQVWVMGSKGDKAVAGEIVSAIDSAANTQDLSGRTTLEDAIDLMSLANYVVSNDSGLMHIASALQRPVVALYGATSPEFTPPLSALATTLSIPVDCGPCFQRLCPKKHHRCMEELLPDQVIDVLDLSQ